MQTCKLIPDVGDLPIGFNTNNMIHPGKNTKSTGRDLGCDKDKTHVCLTLKLWKMVNAKEELLKWVNGNHFRNNRPKIIKWAKIYRYTQDADDNNCYIELRPDHTEEEYKTFLECLDFRYDDGYGTQEVDGTVMFTDGTWLYRYEYDGAECWRMASVPTF